MILSVVKLSNVESFSTDVSFSSWVVYESLKSVCTEPYTLTLRSSLIHIGVYKSTSVSSYKKRRASMKLSMKHQPNPIERVDIIRVFALCVG